MNDMKKNILLTVLLSFCLVSCYKEAPIQADKDAPKYELEDSSDPARHFIYEYHKKTGVFILDEYDDTDYLWNVSSISNYRLKRIGEGVLEDAVKYIDDVLLSCYTDDFAKKYMPIHIFLADSVSHSTYKTGAFYDMPCIYGRSYIAIGQLREENFPMDADKKLEATGKIHGRLWGNFICRNGLVTLPEGYFSPSESYYSQSVTAEELKQVGLWAHDELNYLENMAPDRYGDIAHFVEMITTHSEQEMKQEMEGYENLQIKYSILVSTVKEICGTDLQAIGNEKSKSRQ